MIETRSLMHLKMEFFCWNEKLSDETKIDHKELKLDEIPEWIWRSKEDVKRIIKEVVDNLENEDNVANVEGTNYNLKNAEKCLLELFTKDITQNEVKKKFIKNWYNQALMLYLEHEARVEIKETILQMF